MRPQKNKILAVLKESTPFVLKKYGESRIGKYSSLLSRFSAVPRKNEPVSEKAD
jgi:hypothetical protein